jgi:hypothetical protein
MTIYKLSAKFATRHFASAFAHRSSGATSRFLAVDILVRDVALGVGVDGGLVDAGEGALDFAGGADDEAAGRDDGALGQQRARGDDAAGADLHPVEQNGAHADEAA